MNHNAIYAGSHFSLPLWVFFNHWATAIEAVSSAVTVIVTVLLLRYNKYLVDANRDMATANQDVVREAAEMRMAQYRPLVAIAPSEAKSMVNDFIGPGLRISNDSSGPALNIHFKVDSADYDQPWVQSGARIFGVGITYLGPHENINLFVEPRNSNDYWKEIHQVTIKWQDIRKTQFEQIYLINLRQVLDL